MPRRRMVLVVFFFFLNFVSWHYIGLILRMIWHWLASAPISYRRLRRV